MKNKNYISLLQSFQIKHFINIRLFLYGLSSLSIPEPNSEGSLRFSCFISTIGSAADSVGPDIIEPGGGIETEKVTTLNIAILCNY